MIDVEEARGIVLRHTKVGPIETVEISSALHRTLAVPVRSDIDYPPFDRSVMDGFAVRAADVVDAPVELAVVGQVNAGDTCDRRLGGGEAIHINTGAPIPPGADAVVRVEETESSGERVLIKKTVTKGHFITPRGTYVSSGETVLDAGTRITPLEIASAVSAGAARVSVYGQSRVGVLATGNELVEPTVKPSGGQVRNSNQYMLSALVEAAAAIPVGLGVAGDDRAALRVKIQSGLKEDVLCITGGISMGTLDLVPEVLEDCGVTNHFRKMAIKPGRPVIFGTAPGGTLVFALPGNPVSAYVGFQLLVRPALAAMCGRPEAAPEWISASLEGTLKPTSNRRTFCPGCARVDSDGLWRVKPLSWRGSGDAFGMATANAMLMQAPSSPGLMDGQTVRFMLLDRV